MSSDMYTRNDFIVVGKNSKGWGFNKDIVDYVQLIKKEIETKEIEYPLKPLVYELHGYYKETGEKINIKIVSDYLHSLDGKKILFIKNQL